jgi:phage tail protein X
MDTYTSIQGDTADLICRRVYGDESGFVESLLQANRGLADYTILPIGTVVTLPELARPSDLPTISLWE